jgi:enterochelin esterase-like enzyme
VNRTNSLILLALASVQLTWAQTTPPVAARPTGAPSSQLGPLASSAKIVKSPEFLPDGHIIFRLVAPDAQKVTLHANFPSGYEPSILPLSKDEDGVWSITVGPIAPASRFYNFYVDGVAALDPSNPHTRRDGINVASTLIIPGEASALESVQDVPHGTVALIWYPSPSLNLRRRATLYLPPGYESSKRRYPVLYLLHGGGGDEDAWTTNGRAPEILDNLIASGKTLPMIVVMPNGNANQSASQDYVTTPVSANPSGSATSMTMAYPDSLVSDLIPFIDRTYRTQPDREHRAIAGLSMGGGQTMWAAFHHLDQFAWVETMSATVTFIPGAGLKVPPPPNAAELRAPGLTESFDPDELLAALPELRPTANAQLRRFAITIGEHDGLTTQFALLKKTLDEQGIHVTATVVPGYIHEWAFWRFALSEMLPELFQSAASTKRH